MLEGSERADEVDAMLVHPSEAAARGEGGAEGGEVGESRGFEAEAIVDAKAIQVLPASGSRRCKEISPLLLGLDSDPS